VDQFEAIRIQALLDVMEGGFGYHWRRICRWYSATFHTPLAEVDALPVEHILQHFFEQSFEQDSKAERRKLAMTITETLDETKKREAAIKAKTDTAFLKKIAKQAKKEAKEAVVKKAKQEATAKATLDKMDSQDMLAIPNAPDLPDISMHFDDKGNLL
jgi:primosomal protein N'